MAQLPTDRTTANTPAEHVADHNTLHATHNVLDDVGSNGDVLTVVAGTPAWAAQSATSAFVGCKVYRSAALNFTHTSQTPVAFDAEEFDTSTMHDNSTNPSRVTIPTGLGGYWRLTARITYSGHDNGLREVTIRKDGTTSVSTVDVEPGGATAVAAETTTVVNAAAGAYFEVLPFQNSSATLTCSVGAAFTVFIAEFLGT